MENAPRKDAGEPSGLYQARQWLQGAKILAEGK